MAEITLIRAYICDSVRQTAPTRPSVQVCVRSIPVNPPSPWRPRGSGSVCSETQGPYPVTMNVAPRNWVSDGQAAKRHAHQSKAPTGFISALVWWRWGAKTQGIGPSGTTPSDGYVPGEIRSLWGPEGLLGPSLDGAVSSRHLQRDLT